MDGTFTISFELFLKGELKRLFSKQLMIELKLFKVKGEFREGHIGFSGKAPFVCIAISTE